ncbi:hypothetical protein AB9K35_00650 [Leisingera sp. XS_AS12]
MTIFSQMTRFLLQQFRFAPRRPALSPSRRQQTEIPQDCLRKPQQSEQFRHIPAQIQPPFPGIN